MSTSLFSGIASEFPPIRQDMWSLIFPVEMGISERFEVTAARPKISNSRKEIKYKSSKVFYKGSSSTEPMAVEFRDVVGPAVFQKFMAWQLQHYDPSTGCGGYPSVYKKDLILYMEDDCGNPVQKFTYYGCFLVDLDGGELSMESDAEIAKVKMSISYDYFTQDY